MSNLDDVFERMQIFQRALREFNEAVRLSAADLVKSDEEVASLWQDSAGRRYRAMYEPVAQSLHNYLSADAPRFEHFIETKIAQLGVFLHGD